MPSSSTGWDADRHWSPETAGFGAARGPVRAGTPGSGRGAQRRLLRHVAPRAPYRHWSLETAGFRAARGPVRAGTPGSGRGAQRRLLRHVAPRAPYRHGSHSPAFAH
ncbi:hypothetical protein GCM10010377_57250 [Streptomyces viridiviolaceus]|nr:hypothetical protein GCM10010377_57250 [Streptomyces viridiviolaceus]